MTVATLTYITGAPGSGKTLNVLSEVEKLRRETRRPVYYDGIDGVEFPEWIEIEDINKVHELPTGAIIVVDEAQRHWPQRSNRNPVPASVEPFATHRHRGHTFYIMTQRFTAVDHFIRGVANRHLHLIRAFGLPRARVFEWSGKVANPDDKWNRKEANAYTFWYWKWALWAARPLALGMYKSSDLHTVKAKLPLGKVLFLLAVAAGILHGITRFNFAGIGEEKKPEPVTAPGAQGPVQVSDAERWALPWKERVAGHPFSAPAYDELYRPATIPRIDGCVSLRTDNDEGGDTQCSCYTQQKTRITTMTIQQCEFYVANGWFDPTKPDVQEAGSGIQDFGAASNQQDTVASAAESDTAASIAGSVFGF